MEQLKRGPEGLGVGFGSGWEVGAALTTAARKPWRRPGAALAFRRGHGATRPAKARMG